MNIPQKVRIGAIDYEIKIVPSTADALQPGLIGKIDENTQIITLQEGAEQSMLCTFLHEIVHGILYNAGYGGNCEHDERLVDAMAHGLLMLVRDNPTLLNGISL